MREDSVLPLVKVQSLTRSEFLSYVGGFMKFFAGMSVLSLMDIFFLLVKYFSFYETKVHSTAEAEPTRRVAWGEEDHALYQLSQDLIDFIKFSNVHGLHYVNDQSEKRWQRVFWLFLVISSMAFCSALILDIYNHINKI